MASLFNPDHRFPISLLAMEKYEELSTQCKTDEEHLIASCVVMKEFCGVGDPEEEDITYFASRLSSIVEDIDKEVKKKKERVSFGTSYAKYIGGARVDLLLTRMCNYDYDRAKYLYSKVDRDHCLDLIRDFITQQMEFNQVLMEASMYGFGGKYKDDKQRPTADASHDLNSEQGMAALQKMGF